MINCKAAHYREKVKSEIRQQRQCTHEARAQLRNHRNRILFFGFPDPVNICRCWEKQQKWNKKSTDLCLSVFLTAAAELIFVIREQTAGRGEQTTWEQMRGRNLVEKRDKVNWRDKDAAMSALEAESSTVCLFVRSVSILGHICDRPTQRSQFKRDRDAATSASEKGISNVFLSLSAVLGHT